jgi:hypothetical protein
MTFLNAKSGITGAAIGLLMCLTGCMALHAPAPTPPDTTLFEEGDLILTFSGTPRSWMFAFCTDPEADRLDHPYSHVEMLFRNAKGHWMVGGISSGHVAATRLSQSIKGFQHIGVYRSNASREDRSRVADLLKRWLKDPDIQKAQFDLTLQDVPGRRDKFCCVGIINELHRAAGLKAPFASQQWTPNAFGRHMEDLLNTRLKEITTADSLKLNPDFTCIAHWRNDKRDPTIAQINETVARLGFQWYEQGWRMRTSQGIHLGLLLINAQEDLNNTVRTQAHLQMLMQDVYIAWSRLLRRGQLEGLDESEKQSRLEAICQSFRERHMVFVGMGTETQP